MFPEKIHHVILFVLSEIRRNLGKTELDNILYLIDVESTRFTSQTMTQSTYVRKEWGPYSVDLNYALNEMKWYEIKETTEIMEKSKYEKRSYSIEAHPRFQPELNEQDINIIQRVLTDIKDLGPIEIKRKCYHTAPMEMIIEKEGDEKLIDEELEFI